jgi:PAS domain S-box-containing protein
MEHLSVDEESLRQLRGSGQESLSLKNVEAALLESKQRYERLVNTIPCALYDYVRWPDGRSQFVYISKQCEEIFEYDAERILAEKDLLWKMVHPNDLERLKSADSIANLAGALFQCEVRIILPSGQVKWIQLTSKPGSQQIESQVVWSGVVLDITERKVVEEERDKLVIDLKRALTEVRTLSGFLPICASCKKIRDDNGYWNQIESYIRDHSEAEFSHSICPDCAKELYPEFDLSVKQKST